MIKRFQAVSSEKWWGETGMLNLERDVLRAWGYFKGLNWRSPELVQDIQGNIFWLRVRKNLVRTGFFTHGTDLCCHQKSSKLDAASENWSIRWSREGWMEWLLGLLIPLIRGFSDVTMTVGPGMGSLEVFGWELVCVPIKDIECSQYGNLCSCGGPKRQPNPKRNGTVSRTKKVNSYFCSSPRFLLQL